MEETLKQFLDIGVIGVIAYVCFKTVLEDKKKSEELRQKESEQHKAEIKEITDTYREELKKDRETYIESMNIISNELKEVKNDVKTIKEKVGV